MYSFFDQILIVSKPRKIEKLPCNEKTNNEICCNSKLVKLCPEEQKYQMILFQLKTLCLAN